MPTRESGGPGIPDLRAARSVLPKRRGGERTAVLLAADGARGRLAGWLAALTGDRVTVLAPEPSRLAGHAVPVRRVATLDEVLDHLRRADSVDLVVNLSEQLPAGCIDHGDLLLAVLPYLAKQGAFVHDRIAVPDAGDGGRDPAGVLDETRDASARDVGVVVTRELVVVQQRRRRLLMLRERDVPDVLATREPSLSVDELAALPEGDFVSRATVHHHGGEPSVAPMHPVLHHPRLVTRHYRGPVSMSGRTLMWTGTTVLPDSFRWHLAGELSNPHLHDLDGEHARLKRRHSPRRSLDGDFYQLESSYPSHFGHVLTEVVSRMWGWDEAKRRMPGLRVLVHPRPGFDNVVERSVLAAYGVAADDVVNVTGPVQVSSVVSASPMWHNAEPHYVHPDLAGVWARIGEGLRGHESGVETSSRIFVSRSEATANNARICRNLHQVERRFAAHGFTILYPEQHPLADQARLFREARVVAGFGGSALFNVMHTRRLEALVVLNHSGYYARNEHLFASVKGGESHYFWSPPDAVAPDPWSAQALRASWEFDERRLAGELDRLLTRL